MTDELLQGAVAALAAVAALYARHSAKAATSVEDSINHVNGRPRLYALTEINSHRIKLLQEQLETLDSTLSHAIVRVHRIEGRCPLADREECAIKDVNKPRPAPKKK